MTSSFFLSLAIGGLLAVAAIFGLFAVIRFLKRRNGEPEGDRLRVVEHLEIDDERRLVLVRRDETEHLLLIGGKQDLVIEASIERGAGTHMGLEEEGWDQPAGPVAKPRPGKVHVLAPRAPNLRKVDRDEPRLNPLSAPVRDEGDDPIL